MLRGIFKYLNTVLLRESNLFGRCYGLCQVIEKDDRQLPAQLVKNEWVPVEVDKSYGISFWRQTGSTSIDSSNETTRANKLMYVKDYPMRLVCVVPGTKYPINDAYRADRTADEVLSLLSGYSRQLAGITDARSVRVAATNVNTNREEILSSEFPGQSIDFDVALIAIDFSIQVTTAPDCLKTISEASEIGDFDILEYDSHDHNVNTI